MDPIKCAFCQHGNPANSRFCNACGAPLGAQRCPQCGAVSEGTATTCPECGALHESGQPDDFFLPLPPEGPPPGTVPRPVAPAATEVAAARETAAEGEGVRRPEAVSPLADRASQETAAPSPPAEAATPSSAPVAETTAATASPVTQDQEAARAGSESAAAVLFRDPSESRSRRRPLAWVAVLGGLGIAAYFGYNYFQRIHPSDVAPRAAATREAKDGARSDKATAAPSAPSIEASKPGVAGVTAKVTAGEGAGGKGSRNTDPAGAGAAKPPAPTDIFIAKPEPEPQRAPRGQEAAKTAAAGTREEVRRPASSDGSVACTDSLAALGLCKQENTQGRKP